MLLIVPTIFAVLVLVFAGYWRMHHSRRQSESWDDIVATLRPSDKSSASGLWAAYCNAAVRVQLADYAAEHGNEGRLPEEVLESIRTEAFRDRISALAGLLRLLLLIPLLRHNKSSSTA